MIDCKLLHGINLRFGGGVVVGVWVVVVTGESMHRRSPDTHALQESSRASQLWKRMHLAASDWNVNQRQLAVELHSWRHWSAEVEATVSIRIPSHSPATKQTASGGVQLCSPVEYIKLESCFTINHQFCLSKKKFFMPFSYK
jgi:hypothetical protein